MRTGFGEGLGYWIRQGSAPSPAGRGGEPHCPLQCDTGRHGSGGIVGQESRLHCQENGGQRNQSVRAEQAGPFVDRPGDRIRRLDQVKIIQIVVQ